MHNVIQFPSPPSTMPQYLIDEGLAVGMSEEQCDALWTFMCGNIVKTKVDEIMERREKEEKEFLNTARNEIGNKYEETKDLDVADIAKLVRKDIADAKKSGALPKGLKTSVKISRYAGGQSLRVIIKDLDDMDIFTQGAKDHIKETGCIFQYRPIDTYNEKFVQMKKTLEAIHESYNFDKSDSMTDYFHVNYYGQVELDYELKTVAIDRALK